MIEEDLLVPSSETCNESLPTFHDLINNDVQQSFIVVKTLRDLALEAINEENLNTADNEQLSESSVIATIILMDIFDKALKRAKQLKRWRIPNPASWKVNVAKKRRAEGSVYAIKNKIRPAKVPKKVDCSKCSNRCSEKINEENRNKICRKYWNLDFIGQKNFILANVAVKNTKTLTLDRKRRTTRAYSTQCSFEIENERVIVCQKFFCTTLCISQSVVQNAVKNKDFVGQYSKDKDPRGMCGAHNKTRPEKVQEVHDHILSFPSMESHYVRKKSKRQYLDRKLSIAKMYSLYVDECKKKNSKPVSEITYRRIFCNDFNLGFFKPKKDQCLICTKYARYDAKDNTELEKQFAEHIARKEACNKEKENDKIKAGDNKDFLSASFDLQAILQIPSGDIGLLYYTRKLTVYNLTVYESALPNHAYCFTWSEVNGKKGSAEIGTILYHYLSNCIPNSVTEVSLFSDTCGGQNRNKNVAAILLWAVQKIENLQIIEQKFLESGHSHMEADSMHSAIETEQKYTDIYSMPDWINVFKKARSKKVYIKKENKKVVKNPYVVKEFKYDEFKDLKDLSNKILLNTRIDTEGKQVKWLKIKRLRYIKGENKIFYNYVMSENFSTIDVTKKNERKGSKASENLDSEQQREHNYGTRNRKKRTVDEAATSVISERSEISEVQYFPDKLLQLYKKPLSISVAKKRDLLQLCSKGVIPEEYHPWFNNLNSDAVCKDRVPDCTVSDDESAISSDDD